MLFYKCGVILTAFLKLKSWVATTPSRPYRKKHCSTNGSFCVPRGGLEIWVNTHDDPGQL